MDLFSLTFSQRLRRILDGLVLVAMIGLCGFACIQAWKIVQIMASNGQVSITAGIPMTIPYSAFVLGFALITVAAIVVALRRNGGGSKPSDKR
jgi:TRAP-type C4-dicarboxylate transport system permease small subunit